MQPLLKPMEMMNQGHAIMGLRAGVGETRIYTQLVPGGRRAALAESSMDGQRLAEEVC